MAEINLDQLEKLADNAWQMFNHWFNAHQIADGITDQDVAALISVMTPATVLGLIERVRKAEEAAEERASPSPVGGAAELPDERTMSSLIASAIFHVAGHPDIRNGQTSLAATLLDAIASRPAALAAPKNEQQQESECDSALRAEPADQQHADPEVERGLVNVLYPQAVLIVRANNRASISLLQRYLVIGYNRAARLLEAMEHAGVVSAMDNMGKRTVAATPSTQQETDK